MTYAEVKDVTSTAVGSEDDGSLFDVTIANYVDIRDKAEAAIVQAIRSSFPVIFRQYINKAQWTTIGDVPTPSESTGLKFPLPTNVNIVTDLAITAELDSPLRVCLLHSPSLN